MASTVPGSFREGKVLEVQWEGNYALILGCGSRTTLHYFLEGVSFVKGRVGRADSKLGFGPYPFPSVAALAVSWLGFEKRLMN